jgi:hypothetical protein
MAQSFKMLLQFLMFTEGFMRGEEDAEGHEEQRSPFITSPKNKSGRWKNGRDRSKGVRQEDKQYNPPPKYRPHFITYAKLTKPQ